MVPDVDLNAVGAQLSGRLGQCLWVDVVGWVVDQIAGQAAGLSEDQACEHVGVWCVQTLDSEALQRCGAARFRQVAVVAVVAGHDALSGGFGMCLSATLEDDVEGGQAHLAGKGARGTCSQACTVGVAGACTEESDPLCAHLAQAAHGQRATSSGLELLVGHKGAQSAIERCVQLGWDAHVVLGKDDGV